MCLRQERSAPSREYVILCDVGVDLPREHMHQRTHGDLLKSWGCGNTQRPVSFRFHQKVHRSQETQQASKRSSSDSKPDQFAFEENVAKVSLSMACVVSVNHCDPSSGEILSLAQIPQTFLGTRTEPHQTSSVWVRTRFRLMTVDRHASSSVLMQVWPECCVEANRWRD